MSLSDHVQAVIQAGFLTAETEQIMMNQFVESITRNLIREDEFNQIEILIEALNQNWIFRNYSPSPHAYIFLS